MLEEIKRLEADNQNLSVLNAAMMNDGNGIRDRIHRLEDALARLEAAYLDEARENIQATRDFLQERQTPEEYQAEIDALARAALERIKNGDE